MISSFYITAKYESIHIKYRCTVDCTYYLSTWRPTGPTYIPFKDFNTRKLAWVHEHWYNSSYHGSTKRYMAMSKSRVTSIQIYKYTNIIIIYFRILTVPGYWLKTKSWMTAPCLYHTCEYLCKLSVQISDSTRHWPLKPVVSSPHPQRGKPKNRVDT